MQKDLVGKLTTAAFFAVFLGGAAWHALVRPFDGLTVYAAFAGFFLVWGLTYWRMSKRGYFDWFDGR